MHACIRERNLFTTSVDAPSAKTLSFYLLAIDEMNGGLGTLCRSNRLFPSSRPEISWTFKREKEKQSRGGKQMFSWHWSSISPAACSSTLSQWLLKSATARREREGQGHWFIWWIHMVHISNNHYWERQTWTLFSFSLTLWLIWPHSQVDHIYGKFFTRLRKSKTRKSERDKMKSVKGVITTFDHLTSALLLFTQLSKTKETNLYCAVIWRYFVYSHLSLPLSLSLSLNNWMWTSECVKGCSKRWLIEVLFRSNFKLYVCWVQRFFPSG